MTDDHANHTPTFSVEQVSDGSEHRLLVTGEVDVATSPDLRRALAAMIEADAVPMIVDMTELTFIDSSGLGVLVAARNRLRESGREHGLVLRGLREPIRKVFEITGLNDLFVQDQH